MCILCPNSYFCSSWQKFILLPFDVLGKHLPCSYFSILREFQGKRNKGRPLASVPHRIHGQVKRENTISRNTGYSLSKFYYPQSVAFLPAAVNLWLFSRVSPIRSILKVFTRLFVCFLCFLGEAGPWMFLFHHFHWRSCVLKFFDGRIGKIYSLPKYNKNCIKNLNYRVLKGMSGACGRSLTAWLARTQEPETAVPAAPSALR